MWWILVAFIGGGFCGLVLAALLGSAKLQETEMEYTDLVRRILDSKAERGELRATMGRRG